jgi:hypothetical protein
MSTSIIGAGLSCHLIGEVVSSRVARKDLLIAELSKPKVVFCVNGYYRYSDVFNSEHHLTFQMLVGVHLELCSTATRTASLPFSAMIHKEMSPRKGSYGESKDDCGFNGNSGSEAHLVTTASPDFLDC